jgi:hypothetical protein
MKGKKDMNKLLTFPSWVIGVLVASLIGVILLTFAVIGYAAGYVSNPIVGFLTTVCTTITCLPLILGLVVGLLHNKARKMLANFLPPSTPSA